VRLLLACALLLAACGCKTVRFNEQERLQTDRALAFDFDALDVEMRGRILTPREGALGGFTGSAGAGGCGCN
jgi:hypothetical protein